MIYNQKGNEVLLIKYIQPSEGGRPRLRLLHFAFEHVQVLRQFSNVVSNLVCIQVLRSKLEAVAHGRNFRKSEACA